MKVGARKLAERLCLPGRALSQFPGGRWVAEKTGLLCFAAGTQVVVGINEDGSLITRNIEELQVGDIVLTRNADDPEAPLEYRPITETFINTLDHLRIVEIQDASGNIEFIRSSESHPFYVEGLGWIDAKDLAPGMQVQLTNGSNPVILSNSYEAHPEGIVVYNFAVTGSHTYFVEDGQGQQSAIWVHNACYARNYWTSVGREEALKLGQGLKTKYSVTNIQRMLNGQSPLMRVVMKSRNTGELKMAEIAVELHHWRFPQRSSAAMRHEAWNLVPATRWGHEAMDQFRHAGWDLVKILNGPISF